MSTVFVVQEMPNHDISQAMRFGEIKVLLAPNTQIAFSTVPTVRVLRRKLRDYKDGDSTGATERQSPDLGKEVVTFHRGTTPPPSEAQTVPSDSSPQKPRRKGLNPRFGLWLMGFPVAWLDSAPSATPSSRKSRKSSGT